MLLWYGRPRPSYEKVITHAHGPKERRDWSDIAERAYDEFTDYKDDKYKRAL